MEWLLFIITGMVAGFLAGLLGISGGVVLMPFLSSIFFFINGFSLDMATHLALGTTIAIVLVNTLVTIYGHMRVNSVNWTVVKRFLPGLVIGGAVGPLIADVLSGVMLSILVGLFILIIALRILFVSVDQRALKLPQGKNMFAVSLGIGTVSSLIGSGGSSFAIPFFLRCRMPMRQAIGAAVFCTIPLVSVASVGFVVSGLNEATPIGATGYIYWPALLCVLIGSLGFTVIGVNLGHRVSVELLRKMFAVLLLIIAAKMLLMAFV